MLFLATARVAVPLQNTAIAGKSQGTGGLSGLTLSNLLNPNGLRH
jgi:hypothetical protein